PFDLHAVAAVGRDEEALPLQEGLLQRRHRASRDHRPVRQHGLEERPADGALRLRWLDAARRRVTERLAAKQLVERERRLRPVASPLDEILKEMDAAVP